MSADHKNTGDRKKSVKRLLKILVIVGVGIPVLIELMTLFNLLNVQFFEENNERSEKRTEEVEGVREGDLLFADEAVPIRIGRMRIQVSAREWEFELALFADESVERLPGVRLDSIKLANGNVMKTDEELEWDTDDSDLPEIEEDWDLPPGLKPEILYMNTTQPMEDGSLQTIQQEFRLLHVPLRYSKD